MVRLVAAWVMTPLGTSTALRSTCQSLARQADQQFAGGRGGPANCGNGPRRGSAAGRRPVVGNQGRIGHDHLDTIGGHPQFFGRGLGHFGPRALAQFDLADHDGDRAVVGQMNPGRDVLRTAAAAESPAAAALPQGNAAGRRQQQPGAENLHELAPAYAGFAVRPRVRFKTSPDRSFPGSRIRWPWFVSTRMVRGRSRLAGRAADRAENLGVAVAAAEVAVDPLQDFFIAGMRIGCSAGPRWP